MKPVTQSNFDQIQWLVLEKQLMKFSPVRVIVAPLFWGAILLTLWGDTALWRRFVLGGLVVFGVISSIAHLVFPSWHPGANSKPPWMAHNVYRRALITAVVLGIFILAAGGFDGPLLPVAIPIVFFIGAVGQGRVLVATATASSITVLVMAILSKQRLVPDALPAIFGGGPNVPQPTSLLYAKTGVIVLLILWAAAMARMVRTTFRETLEQSLKAKDEFLEDHESHARELNALTGELAHELKNPLASIKGLAILIGRDVREGKAAERLSVLREEVDRMEQSLQSFLTFSRPLLPLNQSDEDLSQLCASVLAMHEGMAHVSHIALNLSSSGPVALRCDARKIKQVLINLLQNAIEVSPANANVEVRVSARPEGGAQIEIEDEGPGISPRIRERLFQPGVTDKEQGSGLGLALARGLVRQHGGELTLANRAERGCKATVWLPERTEPASLEVS